MDFIIAIIAAWRITSVINREKIGAYARKVLAKETPDPYIPNEFTYSDSFLSNMVTCFWCLSFWVSIFCVVMYYLFPVFLYPFAISAVVIFLDEKVM